MDRALDTQLHGTGADGVAGEIATKEDGPFYWRVAHGVLYAQMPLTRSIRPPLLSAWESERVTAFKNRDRRFRWLAGRALAKAIVKERLGMRGIIEIRDGASGEPVVYQDGFPRADVWLSIAVRHGQVSCVLADRPVALEIRTTSATERELVDRFVERGEQRTLRRLVGTPAAARAAGWAIKEAARRATRVAGASDLAAVRIDASLGVDVDAYRLQVLALRYVDDIAVAIVGRAPLEDTSPVRIVLDAAAQEAATPRLQGALERSLQRARRIADARRRWGGVHPEPT